MASIRASIAYVSDASIALHFSVTSFSKANRTRFPDRKCSSRSPAVRPAGRTGNRDFAKIVISFDCSLSAISRPRFRSVTGQALPSPRLVSIVVHADVSHLHGRYTLMLMQYGQFLDHDITLTPVNKVRPVNPSRF